MDTITPQMQDTENEVLAYMKARDEQRRRNFWRSVIIAGITAVIGVVVTLSIWSMKSEDERDEGEVNEYLCVLDPGHPRCD